MKQRPMTPPNFRELAMDYLRVNTGWADESKIASLSAELERAYELGANEQRKAKEAVARLLLKLEWRGLPLPTIGGSEWRTCVSCGDVAPKHWDGCELAALRAAGELDE